MNKLQQLDFINKTMPTILEAFKELGITEIKSCEGDINYYLTKEKDKIQFIKETYDKNHFSQYVSSEFYSIDDDICAKVCVFTEILKGKVMKLIENKINKLSSLKNKF